MTIEDVILSEDRRGMRRLRPYLPDDFCRRAAWALFGASARVLVVSGFHVEQKCETDGPPGALAIAQAIRALGGEAILVSDGHSAQILADLDAAVPLPPRAFIDLGTDQRVVIDFPYLDPEASDALCGELLAAWQPTAVVAVERCGLTDDGTYRNSRGEDISAVTARVDALFRGGLTIGVGDGGNEIGMGSLAEPCLENGVIERPCRTAVLFPVIASVSNWGALGICAGLSIQAGRDLLPAEEQAASVIRRIVELDGIDGILRQSVASVDGRPLEENLAILRNLHAIVGP
jgi:hypothetical protein